MNTVIKEEATDIPHRTRMMNGVASHDSGYHSDLGHPSPRSSSSTPDAIDTLGRQARALVTTINKLGEVGIESAELPLPKIVVVGDQSAGKSSLIEAISEIKVPRAAGTCTRCVLQINLIAAKHESCKISLINKYSFVPGSAGTRTADFGDWQLKSAPEQVPAEAPITITIDDAEQYLLRAQQAILSPHLDQAAILAGHITSQQHVEFSPNVIKLDIAGPKIQTLTLFDLPGIINHVENDSEDLPALVQGLAQLYTSSENTIVVLACPINVDLETSTAASLIRRWNATRRTIGVLTKPDTLQLDDDVEQWIKVLSGRKFNLGYGYFVTKQPTSTELKQDISHATAREKELEFFSKDPWTSTFSQFKNRFGTYALQAELSNLLAGEIATCLPGMKITIGQQLHETRQRIKQYPEPPKNPYATVMSLVDAFQRDVELHLHGEFPNNRLVNTWREYNKEFLTSLKKTQPLVVVNTGTEDQWRIAAPVITLDSDDEEPRASSNGVKRGASVMSSQESPTKKVKTRATPSQQNSLASKFHLESIRLKIMEMTSSGVPTETDPRAEDHLISESMRHWEQLLIEYLNAVRQSIQQYLSDIVAHHTRQWMNTKLHKDLADAVKNCFETIYSNYTMKALQSLAAEQLKPYTSNTEALQFFRNKELVFLKEQRHAARARSLVAAKEKASNRPQSSNNEDLKKKATSVKPTDLGEDPYGGEIQVMGRIRGYYQLACGTFVDNVSKAGQLEVFAEMTRRTRAAVENGLGIDGEIPNCVENCRMLLSEDPERERTRAELVVEETKLQKALQLLEGIKL